MFIERVGRSIIGRSIPQEIKQNNATTVKALLEIKKVTQNVFH